MDSSLVRLDLAAGGALRGQWQLDDPRLSLRHLARARNGAIGVALQAEHDDPARRATAPLLAVWQGGALRAIDDNHPPAAGYGGDIAALGERFFVSATRAGQLLSWTEREGWVARWSIDQAGALALADGRLWCGTGQGWVQGGAVEGAAPRLAPVRGMRLDNHAVGVG
jgi:hypothetical protein